MAHTVTLVWTPSVDAVDGVNVYRGSAAGQETTKLNAALVTASTFTDPSPLAGHDFYVVKSVLGGVESLPSIEASVVLLPASPTQLVATLN